MDHDAEEKERGFSMSLSLAQFEWRDHKVNLLDSPGFPDFVGEVAAGLRVTDLVVFVVNAVDGIEVQTEIIWKMASKANIPRVIFVNKLDRERASFDTCLAELQDRFGAGIAPLQLPIGQEANLSGVIDLLADVAYVYAKGVSTEGPIPAEMSDQVHAIHDALIEGIVVAEDDLLEKYLDDEIEQAVHADHRRRRSADDRKNGRVGHAFR